jgi:hypothetical protein
VSTTTTTTPQRRVANRPAQHGVPAAAPHAVPSPRRCDEDNNRIRKIDLRTRTTTTLAGSGHAGVKDGPGSSAKFNYPGGIGLDESGNIYVGDYEGQRIRVVAPPALQVEVA